MVWDRDCVGVGGRVERMLQERGICAKQQEVAPFRRGKEGGEKPGQGWECKAGCRWL